MKIAKFNEMINSENTINLQDYIDQNSELNESIKRTVESHEMFGNHVRSFGSNNSSESSLEIWKKEQKRLYDKFDKLSKQSLKLMPDISQIAYLKIYDTILTSEDTEFMHWDFDIDFNEENMGGTYSAYLRYKTKISTHSGYNCHARNIWITL
jgi:hypothetical protein